MSKEASDHVQIAVRIPTAWLARFDQIAASLSRPGIELTRADAMRAAMAQGLEQLTTELKAKSKR